MTGEVRDPLLQPYRLGQVTLRNRIMSTSHACGLGEGGMPADRYQAYHLEKARGGLGLTMFGGSSNVSVDSPSVMPQLNLGIDEVIPHLTRFSSQIHEAGSALMCQITHLGRRGEFDKDAMLPTIAPSVIRETLHRSIPKEMGDQDIARVTADFVAAARRCQIGGLDGIECLSGAHLIGQFLSPAMNQRSDSYGGSLENRCRFGIDIFKAIRKAVGPDFLLGFRFIVDEGHAEGLGFAESLAIAHRFQAEGVLDFFNAIYGRMDTYAGLAIDNMPGMASPTAPWLTKAAAFREQIDLPVMHAARISDVATARHAIAEGLIDLVGMTRAHIADPHLVEKIAAGEEHRIRPCVGATHCMSHRRPTCLHNPATGHEAILNHRIEAAPSSRRVVIVGAGPGGLEAARVAAERGHQVTLFEAAPRAGGQVLLASRASWRRDMIGIVDWRIAEIERLGVDLQCGVFASTGDVMACNPDLVIIATGGIPNIDRVPGGDQLTSPWDIIQGTVAPAADVLVIDGTGRHVAMSAADVAHAAGARVSLVTIDETLAMEQAYAERVIWRKWAAEAQIETTTEHALVGVRREGNRLVASLQSELTGTRTEKSAAQVVFDYGTVPADALFHDLAPLSRNEGITDLGMMVTGSAQPQSTQSQSTQPQSTQAKSARASGFELHRIGDSVASRNINAAVTDALRLCQNC